MAFTEAVLAESVTLGWTPPANTSQIAGYQVHYGLTSGRTTGQYQSVQDVSGASTATATVPNLRAGSTYYFAVRSRSQNASQVSSFSNEISTLVAAAGTPDTTAPRVTVSAAPTGPVSTAQTVTISGSASDNVGVSRVEFYDGSTLRGTDSSSPYSYAWSVTSTANGTHSWTARAYDAAGNVGTSSALTYVVNIPSTTDRAAPTSPTNLSATAATTRINLTWTASTDNVGVTAYLVERCQGTGCTSFTQVGSVAATSYADTSLTAGSTYRYRVRSRDAANNFSAYSSVATAVAASTTPSASCTGSTLWAATTRPTGSTAPNGTSAELGMKFRSDVDGVVCGVRFYKGYTNTGTHTGSLWSSSGTLLARATFTQEAASGWQQVRFASPVAIRANTVYVVSYLAPNGGFSYNQDYFASAGVDTAPLHALRSGVSGGNGVYVTGSGFPTGTWASANFWVDVVFVPSSATASLSSLSAEVGRMADSIGVYRPGTRRFYLDTDGNDAWSADDTVSEPFGISGDVAIVGDWTGDGVDKIGAYRPTSHTFVLDTDGTDSLTTADVTVSFYGSSGDLPVIGDWNGDGIDEIGAYRPSTGRFYLDVDNSFSATAGDVESARIGTSQDRPVAGDWNGDGVDDIGFYRPSTGRFYLDTDSSYSWTGGDIETDALGTAEDLPTVGDWNADGTTDLGIYRPSTRAFALDSDGSDSWTSEDVQSQAFGNAGDQPVTGHWTSGR